jgi:Fungal chitosanase of glycosyl hydrolase group 75
MSDLTKIDSVAGVTIWSVSGAPTSFIYKAGAAIDADGSSSAYGPNNSGDDWSANGGNDSSGKAGAWWGGPVGSDNKPIVQKIYEPSPGMYVSGTSHVVPGYSDEIQYRYIDSKSIPFIVLPGRHANNARLGDVCLCYNSLTSDNCFGIYADVGPADSIGELSMRMATALGLNNDPKGGGTSEKSIIYLVFPGSSPGWQAPNVWFNAANNLFKQWGGLDRLKKLIPDL